MGLFFELLKENKNSCSKKKQICSKKNSWNLDIKNYSLKCQNKIWERNFSSKLFTIIRDNYLGKYNN